jgi:Domain of unknown function (DUF4145)
MPRISKGVEVREIQAAGRGGEVTIGAAFLCPRDDCHMPSVVFLEFSTYMGDATFYGTVGQLSRGRATPMKHLPEMIAKDRDEAWSCLYGGDYRASLIMGRAAIQRAVRTLEAEGDTLNDELRDLRDKGRITEDLMEYAHEVRIAGNDAAHPDELGEVTNAEAEESLTFMDEFLRHVIAMPTTRRARGYAEPPGSLTGEATPGAG